jgi:lysophospholipase L1-like esterase
MPRFLLASILAAAAASLVAAEPAKIAIVGDSTVCDYPPESPARGWGQFIAGYFDDSVKVVNLAASGRSTKTFLTEGRWAKTLAEKPALVLIQFGHNDSHPKERPESTDAATDYRENLRRYIDDARAAGATPVLVTPMLRRNWNPDGTLLDILQPYADAMKAVAAERKVPVIDLYTMSRELYLKVGQEKCAEFANLPTDHTHFGEKGARAMAELVMSKFAEAVPDWKARLKAR